MAHRLFRFLFTSAVISSAALIGCGSDDSGGGSGGSGGSGAGNTGGSGGGNTGGSGGGNTGGSGGGSAGTSTGGSAGTGTGGSAGSGTGGSAGGTGTTAQAFCEKYSTVCGFSDAADHYKSQDDCIAKFNGYSDTRAACVVQHLGFAETQNNPDTHCPHAAGMGPCSGG